MRLGISRLVRTKEYCSSIVSDCVLYPGSGILSQRCTVDGAPLSLPRVSDIFPLKLRWLLRLTLNNESALERFKHPTTAAFDPSDLLHKALPDSLPVTVNGVIPRLKEGGAFVRFSHDPSTTASEIEKSVRGSLENKFVRPWFNPFHRVSAHLVQGRPWVEDLYRKSRQYRARLLWQVRARTDDAGRPTIMQATN